MRTLTPYLLLAFLAGCGASPSDEAEPSPAAVIMDEVETQVASGTAFDPADFAEDMAPDFLTLGMDSSDAQAALQTWLAATDGEGPRETDLHTEYRTDGHTLLVATRAGLADDAVLAEQIYAEFTPTGPLTNALQAFGLRQKCARGPGGWTVEFCP